MHSRGFACCKNVVLQCAPRSTYNEGSGMDNLTGARPAPYLMATQSLQQRRRIACTALLIALFGAIVLSAAHGPANIPYGTVARLLLRGLGVQIDVGAPDSELASDLAIVNTIRL